MNDFLIALAMIVFVILIFCEDVPVPLRETLITTVVGKPAHTLHLSFFPVRNLELRRVIFLFFGLLSGGSYRCPSEEGLEGCCI